MFGFSSELVQYSAIVLHGDPVSSRAGPSRTRRPAGVAGEVSSAMVGRLHTR